MMKDSVDLISVVLT